MKPRVTIPALAAFVALGVSMLVTTHANAHQTVFHSYYYPYATSAGATYSHATATCRTGYPDYDTSCVNGDYVSVQWWVRTRAQAMVDIEIGEPVRININGQDHWWCNEILYCSDGSTPSTGGVFDAPCGWTVCPPGVSASKVEVSFGIFIPS
jgi:hypothetical protein